MLICGLLVSLERISAGSVGCGPAAADLKAVASSFAREPMARTAEKSTRKKSPRKRTVSVAGEQTDARRRQDTDRPLLLADAQRLEDPIMLEECGLPYSMIPVDISKGDQFKPEFLAISPNNRMPAIVDHDGPGGRPISIFESGAILQYLGRKTGKFYPKDERGRVEVEQWLYWQMANLGPRPARQTTSATTRRRIAICDRSLRQRDESDLRRDERRLEDRELPRRQVFDRRYGLHRLGEPCQRHGQDLSDFANVRRWFKTMLARPAVDRGIAQVEEAIRVTCRTRRCARFCSISGRADLRGGPRSPFHQSCPRSSREQAGWTLQRRLLDRCRGGRYGSFVAGDVAEWLKAAVC